MFKTGNSASTIVAEQGLVQVSDTGEIDAVIEQGLAANPNNSNNTARHRKSLRILRRPSTESLEGKAIRKVVNEDEREIIVPSDR